MCLAVPMRIEHINADGRSARVVRDGVSRDVDVSFIRDPEEGDYVIVHAGFAIERIEKKQAEDVLTSYNELMEEIECIAAKS